MPLALRIRLSQQPMAALVLGLRRVVKRSEGPTPGSLAMTRQLLEWQEVGGFFARDPLAPASAAAALEKLGREARDAPVTAGNSVVGERALSALAAI